MKKLLSLFTIVFALSGCYRVETGQVGVLKAFNGVIEMQEYQQGLHFAPFSTMDIYSVKQIPVSIENLKPKAKDNLSLQDFDATVYYNVNPNMVAELATEYQNSNEDAGDYIFPAYNLVHRLASSATNESISTVSSMEIIHKRPMLESMIKEILQKELDTVRKDVFVIDRVVISNIITDKSAEASIIRIAEEENRKAVAKIQKETAEYMRETRQIEDQSLTPKLLTKQYLEVLDKMASSGNVIIIPADFNGMLNIDPSKSMK